MELGCGLLGTAGSVLLSAGDFPALFLTDLLTAFVNVNTQAIQAVLADVKDLIIFNCFWLEIQMLS